MALLKKVMMLLFLTLLSRKGFRSITLVKRPYKIYAKVLVNRLKNLIIGRMVSESQNTFWKVGKFFYSFLIANEAIGYGTKNS